ncbi:MAG TPA: VWA domain-containing protein [Verrucomicrobiae bacterium]|nr:VWA domain-containing protein [Verrucomicrobiae bacterium]
MRTTWVSLIGLVALASVTSAQSNFFIQDIQTNADGSVTISWPARRAWTYHVMFADSLDGSWQEFPDGQLTAGTNDLTLCYTNTNAPAVSQRFYKVKIRVSQLIMSLVLDRSGSMGGNGGAAALSAAVAQFIDLFDDNRDKVAMISFSYAASTDVPMSQPFKAAINNAVSNLVFSGWTASEQGLAKGLQQNESVVIPPEENVVKVIVFFTDGLANTFQYTFNCGVRNIGPDRELYDPNTGALAGGGCTIPATIPSVSPPPTDVSTTSGCAPLTIEAQKRALVVAEQARQQGNFIYVIGLGDPNGPGECGFPPINLPFLLQIANDPSGPNYNPNEPAGLAVFASTAVDLQVVFDYIASKILVY